MRKTTHKPLLATVDARIAFRAKELFDRANDQRTFRALSPRLQRLLIALGREPERC